MAVEHWAVVSTSWSELMILAVQKICGIVSVSSWFLYLQSKAYSIQFEIFYGSLPDPSKREIALEISSLFGSTVVLTTVWSGKLGGFY